MPITPKWKTTILWLTAGLASAAMLSILLYQVEADDLRDRVFAADPLLLAGVVVSYMATVFFRGIRYKGMLQSDLSAVTWWRLAALHNFYFTFIPFKLGEVSFLPLARKHGIAFGESAPALLASRLYDVFVLLLLGLAGSTSVVPASVVPNQHFLTGVLIAVALFLMIRNVDHFTALLVWLLEQASRFIDSTLIQKLLSGAHESHQWMQQHHKLGVRSMLWTMVIWLGYGVSVYLAFSAMNVQLGAASTLFVMAGMTLVGILGVFTVAGIGVSEMGLAGVLLLVGFPLAEAALFGLLIRFVLLLSALLGTVGVLLVCNIPDRMRGARGNDS